MSSPLILELPRTDQAPRVARRRLSAWLAAAPDRTGLEDALLLASELVTHAVVHGRGRIELRAELDDTRLRVHVLDEGVAVDGSWGLGRGIVEAAASRCEVRPGAADIWFELNRLPA